MLRRWGRLSLLFIAAFFRHWTLAPSVACIALSDVAPMFGGLWGYMWGEMCAQNVDSSSLVPASSGSVAPNAIFTSMAQCSAHTGYPKKVLQAAKRMGAPGFTQNSRILWKELGPYLTTHQGVIESDADHSLEYYKTEIAKRDVVLRDLSIAQKKEELIDPAEIKKFLTKLGVILSSVLKKQRQELQSKCVGYESIINESTVEIFNLIEGELNKWK